MSEQAKREPKDGEWWWCQVHNLIELQALQCAGKEPNEDFYNWNVHEDFYDDVTPIAPVPSYELVAELVEALKDAQGGLDYIRKNHGELYGVGFDRCETQTFAVLAKAKLAGLDVKS